MAEELVLRAVVFKEGDVWLAQCIEYDICAQAATVEEVKERLLATLACECESTMATGGAPFSGIDPAPVGFERLWEHATSFRATGDLTVPGRRDPIDVSMALAA